MIWNGQSSLVKPSQAFVPAPGKCSGPFFIEETSTKVDQTDILVLVAALHVLRPGLPLSTDAG